MLHLVRQVIQSVLGQYRQYEKEKFSTLLSRVEELLQSMESRPPERVVLQPIHTHHNNNEEKMEYDRIVNETFGLHDYDELLLLSVLNHSQNNS
ncbi:hypothetical protein ADEAN_000815200 [Angomonas deanei]|uniref:Uncharacterized protein n=1 Tax=Angomonas deanei TaxID=59799 RepID=A0A7G2CLA1_9TRYP|nr:hypothetical protein ADEAN_000815200 [Angomonas deanei]